jgi:hypothetical protein
MLFVPQKTRWGKRVGGVVGKPKAHGGRFRVGQRLGHTPEQGTHAPGPGPDEPVSCGAPIATNCRAVSLLLLQEEACTGARTRQRTGRNGRRVITGRRRPTSRSCAAALQGNGRSLVVVACMASSRALVRTQRKRTVCGQVVVNAAGHYRCWRLANGERIQAQTRRHVPSVWMGWGPECRAAGGRFFKPSRTKVERPANKRPVFSFLLAR